MRVYTNSTAPLPIPSYETISLRANLRSLGHSNRLYDKVPRCIFSTAPDSSIGCMGMENQRTYSND